MTILSLKIKTYTLTIAGLLLCAIAGAQPKLFRYKADVAKIDSDGVYKIRLQPGFTAKAAITDLSDIRLIDEHGRSIAYSVINDSLGSGLPVFNKFKEIKQVNTDTSTEYISYAGQWGLISNLSLRLKNTEVNRLANLSGSLDLKHWFAIKENIELKGANEGNSSEYEQVINFPTSGYRYYRLQINNKKGDPIKIIRSGIYVTGEKDPQVKLDTLPPATIRAKNGNQSTNYLVELNDKYFVDGMKIIITAPKYYERFAIAHYVKETGEHKLYSGRLSSSRPNFIYFSGKTDKIDIEVKNGDDAPLTVKQVIPTYLERSVVAYLEKGHMYSLLIGDSTAHEVSYDLTFLHSKPMSEFPTISHSAVFKNPAFGANIIVVQHHNFTLLLWGAIIVVLLLLSLLTWRMVKEINARPKE